MYVYILCKCKIIGLKIGLVGCGLKLFMLFIGGGVQLFGGWLIGLVLGGGLYFLYFF